MILIHKKGLEVEMINIFGSIGIGLSLTVVAFSGIGTHTTVNSSTTVETATEQTENCSLTSVQICRSQITDPDTGSIINVSTLKPN